MKKRSSLITRSSAGGILALLYNACATPPPAAHTPVDDVNVSAPSLDRVTEVLREPAPYPDAGLPRGEVSTSRLLGGCLSGVVASAEVARSDSLLFLSDGKVVVERYFGSGGGAIQLRSVTKVITSLAIGMLIADGKIPSPDLPVSHWFPEWDSGLRSQVTVRQLLNHTSGIEHDEGDANLSHQVDSLSWVRGHSVIAKPGTVYSYNNDAVQLLAGIAAQSAGESLASYVERRLFKRLGIEKWTWAHDQAGNTYGYAGLAMTARDLARIGLLIQNEGKWEGAQIVPSSWITQSKRPQSGSRSYGLLMELYFQQRGVVPTNGSITRLTQAGFPRVDRLSQLIGHRFESATEFWLEVGSFMDKSERARLTALASHGILPFDSDVSEQVGVGHSGSFGQYLVVIPSYRVVALRQLRDEHGGSFHDFPAAVIRCLR